MLTGLAGHSWQVVPAGARMAQAPAHIILTCPGIAFPAIVMTARHCLRRS
jgi:hypothetical protein